MSKRSYKYIPELCRDGGPFSGHIVLAVPKYSIRKKLVKKYGIKTSANGEVEFEVDPIESMCAMVEGAKEFVEEVNIKRLHDDKKYKSFEDLECDPSCDNILEDIGRIITSGETLEKK